MLDSLARLEYVYLGQNFFDHNVDRRFLAGSKEIDISGNILTGQLPTHLLQLESLCVLDMSDNTIGSTFPDELSRNEVFEYLSTLENFLQGTIPEPIGQVVNLRHLDLRGIF